MGTAEMIVALVFGIPVCGVIVVPLTYIWTTHRRKMEELRIQKQRLLGEDIRAEFASIRAEIRDLRDTAMQYDLSFDNALHQVEARLARLERPVYTAPGDNENNVSLGGRP